MDPEIKHDPVSVCTDPTARTEPPQTSEIKIENALKTDTWDLKHVKPSVISDSETNSGINSNYSSISSKGHQWESSTFPNTKFIFDITTLKKLPKPRIILQRCDGPNSKIQHLQSDKNAPAHSPAKKRTKVSLLDWLKPVRTPKHTSNNVSDTPRTLQNKSPDSNKPSSQHDPSGNVKSSKKSRKRTKTTKANFACRACTRRFTASVCKDKHEQHVHPEQFQGIYSQRTVPCHLCPNKFYDNLGLKTHLARHTDKRYGCKYCEQTFKDERTRNKHEQRAHSDKISGKFTEKKAQCPFCPIKFYTPAQVRYHEKTHTGEKRYACRFCPERCKAEHQRKIHEYKKHRDLLHPKEHPTVLKCTEREKEFFSEFALNIHLRGHTGERPFKCDLCSAAFASNIVLKRHVMRIHPETFEGGKEALNQHKCAQCPKTFRIKAELKIHEIAHSKERKVECPICGDKVKTKSNLDDHTKRKHPETLSKKPVRSECKECGKTFLKEYMLRRHQRVHTGERPYKCSVCPKTFALNGNRMEHEKRVHTADPEKAEALLRFCCTFCPQKFFARHELKAHERRHTGEKVYPCRFCSTKYSTRETARLHEYKNHRESLDSKEYPKEYNCPHCSNVFLYKNGFRLHMRVHSEERPYKCDVCSKAFKGKNVLRTHQVNLHPEIFEDSQPRKKEYKCRQCPLKFPARADLKAHLDIHKLNKMRLWECSLCDFNCKGYLSLRGHEREVHRDELRHKCSWCDKEFKCKSHLTRHEPVHTGEKRFQCSYCSMAFIRKDSADDHERRKHTDLLTSSSESDDTDSDDSFME